MADDLDTRHILLARGPARVDAPAPLGLSGWPSLLSNFARARTRALRPAVGRRWSRRARAGALLGGAFCAFLLWRGWSDEPAPAPIAQASIVLPAAPAPLPPPAPIRLDDGSLVELRDASSALHREEISSERIRLRLAGGARFALAPGGSQSFGVANPQVLVAAGHAARSGERALGATFSLDPEGARTRVGVEHGRVQVIWWSGATILSAGQSATFPPEDEPAFARPRFFELAADAPREQPKKRAKKRDKGGQSVRTHKAKSSRR